MMENGSFAVNRSPEETVKQFQVYLRKYENDDKLTILEAVERPGSKPGDNYTSEMTRTKLVGTRGDGSPYAKSFMTKMIIHGRKVASLIDISSLFRIETNAYTKILPVLGSFGPPCVYIEKGIIIMEDLAEKGYVNCERRNFLDLAHTVFVLKKLAKLHASGLAMKINNPRQFDTLAENIEEIIYNDKSDTSILKSYTADSMKLVIQYLNVMEPRTQELQNITDYITTWIDKIYDVLYQMFTSPKRKYDTICHGDPWINNLLFLHDNEGRIIDLKLVDYQILRYTSIATDIFYLIYSSVQSSLIERSFESLIKIYHDEFLIELRRLHVDEKILAELGMEWLETELRAHALYGLIVGSFFINPIFAEEEDIQRFETAESALDLQDDVNSEIYRKKSDRIKCVVSQYYRRFKLGIINDDIEPISITG